MVSGGNNDEIDRETLDELYNERGLSTREIAAKIETNHETVRQRLHDYGLVDPERSDHRTVEDLLEMSVEVDLTRSRNCSKMFEE